VHDGEDEEVAPPRAVEEVELRFDEGDVGTDEERAEEEHVIVDDRGAGAAEPGPRVARGGGDAHEDGQGERPDALEIVLEEEAGGGGEEGRAKPGGDAQLGVDREDLAALAGDERVGARMAEDRAQRVELRFEGKHWRKNTPVGKASFAAAAPSPPTGGAG
jgi:hypothetical protein